jgi:hypothetical protein
MNPTLFTILKATPAVTALLGTPILRVFPWGRAPQNVVKPYATYGVFNGNPENYLGQVPDMDNAGTQLNIWAESAASCDACFNAVRDALEPHAHMTNYATPDLDADTNLYSARMEFDFWEPR